MDGKITITKLMNSDQVQIEVTDVSSGVQALRIRMDMTDFAKALLGQGYVECACEWRGLELVGKQRELKHIKVFVPHSYTTKEQEDFARDALVPFEIAGWHGSVRDATNHHNIVHGLSAPQPYTNSQGHWHNVSFTRHV